MHVHTIIIIIVISNGSSITRNLKFVIKWSCIKLCTQVQRYAKRPQLALCCNGPDNGTTTNQPYLLQFCNFPQNRGPTEQTFSCVNVSPGSGLRNTILETNDGRELSLRFNSQRSGLFCCKAVMFSSVYDSCRLSKITICMQGNVFK